MGSHEQFPIQYHHGATDEQEKAKQQFRPVLVPADKGKTDEQGGQKIEEAPQGDQAVIPRPLKELVNEGLKQPVVIVPGLGRGDVGEEGVMGDRPVLPEIPPAGEVIPQVGVVHHDRPSDEVADQDQEKQGDYRKEVISMRSNVCIQTFVYGVDGHSFPVTTQVHRLKTEGC